MVLATTKAVNVFAVFLATPIFVKSAYLGTLSFLKLHFMKIQQEILFNCSAKKLFDALTLPSQFAEATGAAADIVAEPGGKFSCFDGFITGQTIEVEPSNLLVQAWRVYNWEPAVYSIVKFVIEETNDNKAKLIFEHTGFPEDQMPHLDKGWHVKYWEPLKKYLEQ